jgi:O-antigen chain-terminating methyltransferase
MEEIKERQRIYLPFIERARVGTKEAPILDLGCGRGEWLELCGENGLIASGVDMNRMMVSQCQDRGLKVLESDATAFLREKKDNSIGAVTGFHIVEHLEFNQLVSLLDETLRVLHPGGIAIFETPNPENIIVGAYTFYFDPTHRNPIPPALLEYLMKSRGYMSVSVKRSQPFKAYESILDKNLVDLFSCAQDYAVIAYKQSE